MPRPVLLWTRAKERDKRKEKKVDTKGAFACVFLTRWTNRWSLVGTRSVSFVPRVIKSKGEKTEDCYLVSSCVAYNDDNDDEKEEEEPQTKRRKKN